MVAALLLAATSTAVIDRTGRCSGGHVHDSLCASVKQITIGYGMPGNPDGDFHARYEKQLNVGDLRTLLSFRFRHPNERLLDTVAVSGDVSGVSYEVKRALGDDGRPDIETSLAYSAPGGVQLMADTKGTNVDAVSAFHTAGPFNVQPSWLVPTRTLRLTLGRGHGAFRCPFSLTSEIHDIGRGGSPIDHELAMNHEFDSLRKLKARLILPAEAAARKLWAEYQDSQIDKKATWFARASMPFAEPSADKLELSLRRKWQW